MPRSSQSRSPVHARTPESDMSQRLHHGRLIASVSDVVDAGIDLLPHFQLAAIPLLDGAERPAEWPTVRRRLQAEGVRSAQHRGVLLLEPGELDRFSAVGLFAGNDELLLCAALHARQMRAGPAGSAASRLVAVTIEGPAGPLEGLLQVRETTPAIAAVVCH